MNAGFDGQSNEVGKRFNFQLLHQPGAAVLDRAAADSQF
jgi:hypothetical protein